MANHIHPALGRGLGALLPATEESSANSSSQQPQAKGPYFSCPVDFIKPNPYQPRKDFNPDELEGLTASIKEKGVLQPLVVTRVSENRYELIAGERRLRASIMAELETVPVLVREIAMSERLELALVENVQREDLNPLEEAEAYAKLVDEFGLTQEMVSKRVGKNRSTIANSIRILQLSDYAKVSLARGAISVGHAKVMLTLSPEEQRILHDEIIDKKLSVRECEALAKKSKGKRKTKITRKSEPSGIPDSYCKSLTNNLVSYLGSKSRIVQNGTRGKLEIEYYSPDDLERLLALIIKEDRVQ